MTDKLADHVRECVDAALRLSESNQLSEAAIILQLTKPLVDTLRTDAVSDIAAKHHAAAQAVARKVAANRSAYQQSALAAAADPAAEQETASQLLWWMEQTQKGKQQEADTLQILQQYRHVAEKEREELERASQIQTELLAKQRQQVDRESGLRTKAIHDQLGLRERILTVQQERDVIAAETRSLQKELLDIKRTHAKELKQLQQKLSAQDQQLYSLKQHNVQLEDLNRELTERCYELQRELLRASDALQSAQQDDATLARIHQRMANELSIAQATVGSERALREAMQAQFKHKMVEITDLKRALSPAGSKGSPMMRASPPSSPIMTRADVQAKQQLEADIKQLQSQLKEANVRANAAEHALKIGLMQHVSDFKAKINLQLEEERQLRIAAESAAMDATNKAIGLQTKCNDQWQQKLEAENALEAHLREHESKTGAILEEVRIWRERFASSEATVVALRQQMQELMRAHEQLTRLQTLNYAE
eukprot:TRINITY_DN12708_c0_g1_i1.p1 TRINITY_DN12708_c0_g1~~TRINITY_DN12708_c0_g1_i1.p1  ORF type:complete len:507 (+),score=147.76 TRINITY_DN12708_c0_g1_i1:77-1522(+)